MSHRLRVSMATTSLIALAAAGVAAQPPEPPTFKAGTEIVLVDFVVSDKTDRLVKGLTAGDFLVKEDGKERAIVSFAAFAGDAPPAPTASASDGVPTASRAAGAATVLLVDDGELTVQQSIRLRPDLKALLTKLGEGSGTVALVAPASHVSEARTLPFGAGELAASVDRIIGQRIEDHSDLPISETEAMAIERSDSPTLTRVLQRFLALNQLLSQEQAQALARNRATEVGAIVRKRRDVVYDAAMRAFEWLASQPGRHSVVMVSGGFTRDPEDRTFNAVVTGSLRVNAPIHFVDARGLQGFSRFQDVGFGAALPPNTGDAPLAWSEAAQGSAALADDTGGITVRNTNGLSKGLGRILDTIRTYYVIGYEPPAHPKPGYRKIAVEARPKGLSVRARRGYFDAPGR